MFQVMSSVVNLLRDYLRSDTISDQCSESDDDHLENEQDDMELTLDAAVQSGAKTIQVQFRENDLIKIGDELEEQEVIALIYLLSDSATDALSLLQKGFESNFHNILLKMPRTGPFWEKKLCESLCLIQNYKILHELGYDKQTLIQYFQPQHISVGNYVPKHKKALYFLCENLTTKETKALIDLVQKDIIASKKTFSKEYLELYLLHWDTVNYDHSNILTHLKQMDLDELKDKLSLVIKSKPRVQPKSNISANPDSIGRKTIDNSEHMSFSSISSSPGSIQQDIGTIHIDDERYYIDPENPGICIIFNQQVFYREFEKKYEQLLSPEPLSKRTGSDKDYEKLKVTFKIFGFKVVECEDKSHGDILKIIKENVSSITVESSIFVIILSHGDEDIVYGANSCKINVKEIQKIMCKTNKENCQGKPKVLAIQACQGKLIQQLTNDNEESDTEYTTDGGKQAVPETVDFVTFWATIPGFAAIRNEKRGTWFIQSLCDAMLEYGNKRHFLDICTRIVKDVSSKKWKDNVMTPCLTTTLRKDFYLPAKQL